MNKNLKKFNLNVEFLYNALQASTDDYIYIGNIQENTFLVTQNMVEDFGLSGNLLNDYRTSWGKLIHENDYLRTEEYLSRFLDSNEEKFELEYQVLQADGKYVWIRVQGFLQRDDQTGEPLIIIGFLHNMENDGRIDSVTGLYTTENLKNELERLFNGDNIVHGSMLLLGIDNFSSINTLNNHSFGDLVLRNTVKDIRAMLPAGAEMYRFDGDQFAVVSLGCSSEDMYELYQSVQAYTEQLHTVSGKDYRFTVSGSIVCFPEDIADGSDLLKCASIALQSAKKEGKNKCVFYSAEVFEDKMREQAVGQMLVSSINNDYLGFRVVFQPVCEVHNLNIVGAEVLLRFDSLNLGPLSPIEFIPLLENSNLIIPVGYWVLEQSIQVCKKWLEYKPDFLMHVNVSYLHLRDNDFCMHLRELLDKYKLSPHHLVLELTESYFITDEASIKSTLKQLRESAVCIAMDDFGTGYSSLGRLTQFDVDIVKIDRLFVQSLNSKKYNHDFIESVVKLCHNIGMRVCVEGVETKDEHYSVTTLFADYVQGFYISRPVEEKVFFNLFLRQPFDGSKLITLDEKNIQRKRFLEDKELLQLMMDATPLCLNIWNRNFENIGCNQSAVDLFELQNKEEYTQKFFQLSPSVQPDGIPSDVKALRCITEAFENGRCVFEWLHCKLNGEQIWAEITLVRIEYQGDYIVLGFTRDMRQQMALKQVEKSFSDRIIKTIDAMPLACFVFSGNGTLFDCNKEAVTMLEADNKDDVLHNFYQLSAEYQSDGSRSDAKVLQYIDVARREGKQIFEWMHCTKNGDIVPSEVILVRIDAPESDDYIFVGYTRDMRSQIAAEQEKAKAEGRINAMLNAMPLACLLWKDETHIIDCNSEALKLFGVTSEQDVKRSFIEFQPEFQPDGIKTVEKMRMKFQEVYQSGQCSFEWMYVNDKQEMIPSEVKLVHINTFGEDMVVAYSRDLRELHNTLAINSRLKQLVYYDLLTGAASRSSFLEVMERKLDKMQPDSNFVLCMLDFDNFKMVNDTYGHSAGDLTLQKIVSRIISLLPTQAMIGRYGGDEFFIQLWGIQRKEATALIQKLVAEIALVDIIYENHCFNISATIGAVYTSATDKTGTELIEIADKALYEAKRRGRNCAVIVEQE